MSDIEFRKKVEPVVTVETPTEAKPIVSDDITGATPTLTESDEPKQEESALERWETENGKYGIEYFGIKDVMSDFSLKMDFSVVDKYIKAELAEKGYDQTPEKWQEILAGLEQELGTEEMDAFERLKKLSGYIKVLKKFNDIKKKKESYAGLATTT